MSTIPIVIWIHKPHYFSVQQFRRMHPSIDLSCASLMMSIPRIPVFFLCFSSGVHAYQQERTNYLKHLTQFTHYWGISPARCWLEDNPHLSVSLLSKRLGCPLHVIHVGHVKNNVSLHTVIFHLLHKGWKKFTQPNSPSRSSIKRSHPSLSVLKKKSSPC